MGYVSWGQDQNDIPKCSRCGGAFVSWDTDCDASAKVGHAMATVSIRSFMNQTSELAGKVRWKYTQD